MLCSTSACRSLQFLWPWGTPINYIVCYSRFTEYPKAIFTKGIAHENCKTLITLRFCNYIPTLHKNVVSVEHHEYTQTQLNLLQYTCTSYYSETSWSFEEAVDPEKDSMSAAVKILQDCSLSSPQLLESTVYKAFKLLCENEGKYTFLPPWHGRNS